MQRKSNQTRFCRVLAALAIIAVLSAIVPLFTGRYIPTHDGEYHIIRFFEFSKMLSQGYLFPRWAPDLNYGYGLPLFMFHYPLPNYYGAVIASLGFGFVRALFLSMGAAYLVAALFAYKYLRTRFTASAAAAGTLVSAYVPYWFVDLYVRGAVGEVWALAFVFLGLYAVSIASFFLTFIAAALLTVSHNIMAMIFLPLLFVFTVRKNRQLVPAVILGVLSSSWFFLPAIAESRYMVGLNTVSFSEHFVDLSGLIIPSWGTAFSGSFAQGPKMSTQIGLVPLMTLIAAGVLWISRKNREGIYIPVTLTGTILAVILMLPVSVWVWQTFPPLQLLQYPWRLLSLFIPATAVLSAYVVQRVDRPWFTTLLVFAAVTLSYSYVRPVTYEPRSDQYYLTRENFTAGTSSMGNSLSTVWVPAQTAYPEKEVAAASPQVQFSAVTGRYLDKRFSVNTPVATEITVSTLYFPGWKVMVNGREIRVYEKQGIIAFQLPPGGHAVRVFFGRTPVRLFSDILSVTAVLAAAGIWLWNRKKIQSH